MIGKKVRYPLTATTLNDSQCQKLQMKLTKACYGKAGVVETAHLRYLVPQQNILELCLSIQDSATTNSQITLAFYLNMAMKKRKQDDSYERQQRYFV